MKKHIMLCPVCRKELISTCQMRLETLDEHIGNPNGEISLKPAFQCPDDNCPTRLNNIVWDDIEGGTFYIKYISTQNKKEIPFIDGISAPFGSWDRKWEAAKQAEEKANKHIVTFPKWFPGILSQMQVRSNWAYATDVNGKIISRRFGLSWLVLDGQHCIYHTWGMKIFMNSFKRSIRAWLRLRKEPNAKMWRNQLHDTINRMEWPKAEWWRIWSGNVAKFLLKHSPKESLTKSIKKDTVAA